mgnify:FL=1
MGTTDAPAGAKPPTPRKVIIDTDPGVDDTFAILLALRSPEIEVIGLTSLFGNVRTKTATKNALHLLERFGRSDIPVYEGSHTGIDGDAKERIADFVHGDDGFGNTGVPTVMTKEVEGISAAEFIVAKANEFPGEVTVIALASATNVTLALRLDRNAVVENLKQILHLGGAFFVNGNVNASAEANIFGDAAAADELYGSGAKITLIGLDVTQRLKLTEKDLDGLLADNNLSASDDSSSIYSKTHTAFLHSISKFYQAFHVRTTGFRGIFMHDPAAVVLAFRRDLFSLKKGPVRVETEGLLKGQTVLDVGDKKWTFANEWSDRPSVEVALDVDVEQVMGLFRERYGIA